jgi:hypothetical protein
LTVPCLASAQSGFVGPDGFSRYPGVTILCPSGTRAAPCNFSGGGAGGAVSINLDGAPVSNTNNFPVTDPLLDGIISGGALKIGGTVGLSGTPNVTLGGTLPPGTNTLGAVSQAGAWSMSVTGPELSAPGTAGTQAMTVQGATSGIALPVSGVFWQATQPVSAASLPLPTGAATASSQLAVQSAPGTAASTAVTVQGVSNGVALPVSGTFWPATQPVSANSLPLPAGAATAASQNAVQSTPGTAAGTAVTIQGAPSGVSVPVSGTFWQATQPTADAALDPLVSNGALAVSAAALPLPAGAAKALYQTATQGPVAPGTATATASTLLGCQSNTTLPSFTAGQQGAIPCDPSGRLYVVTVPSANNVPTYLQAISSGGAYTFRSINAAASAMGSVVKTSAGLLYGFDVCNSGASAVYFRIFNLGVAPTVGSSTPAISKVVPAGNCQSFSTDLGLTFGTGIALDVTSGSLADSDTATVASANQVAAEIYYH